MTARSRPPTDDSATDVYDGPPRPPGGPGRRVEIGTPTEVSPGAGPAPAPLPPRLPPPPSPASPALVPAHERSEPIRVFSMKSPESGPRGAPAVDGADEPRPAKQHQVRLRRLSEISRRHITPPSGLGYLAPPRDPREARTRRWRDYVIWGSVVVIVGSAVMIGVWLLARM